MGRDQFWIMHTTTTHNLSGLSGVTRTVYRNLCFFLSLTTPPPSSAPQLLYNTGTTHTTPSPQDLRSLSQLSRLSGSGWVGGITTRMTESGSGTVVLALPSARCNQANLIPAPSSRASERPILKMWTKWLDSGRRLGKIIPEGVCEGV
jgi:hypothetical protein